jgi:hypothetical protein
LVIVIALHLTACFLFADLLWVSVAFDFDAAQCAVTACQHQYTPTSYFCSRAQAA